MEVDTSEVPSTSRSSSAGTAVRPKTKGASALQASTQLTGPPHRVGLKTKQRATDQQGIRAMVANVMEHHGIDPEIGSNPKGRTTGGPPKTAYLGRPSYSWSAPCHAGRCFGRRMAS